MDLPQNVILFDACAVRIEISLVFATTHDCVITVLTKFETNLIMHIEVCDVYLTRARIWQTKLARCVNSRINRVINVKQLRLNTKSCGFSCIFQTFENAANGMQLEYFGICFFR